MLADCSVGTTQNHCSQCQSDGRSLAVARVRAKMDSIRQYRPTVAGNLWLLVLPFIFWGLMAFMMKRTEEKWLHNLYGAEYDAYCKRVNRTWPWFPRK